MAQPVTPQRDTAGWFGHPRGLSTLFFTEMWERFSFYGLKALLILFMTAAVTQGGLGFTDQRAGNVIGWYGFGVYASAIDRKSTRLNSSHSQISYAVFCLKKKRTQS